MKKTLLLLILFFSLSLNAQPPSNMPAYTICDFNYDGFETFDLSTQIPAILNGLNPNTTAVSFYDTLDNLQTETNPIPLLYTIITPQTQVIYIHVVDNTNGQVYYSSIDLVAARPSSAGTSGNVTVCETSTIPLNLFDMITGEDGGGTWTRTSGTGGAFDPFIGVYYPSVGATTSTFMYTISANQSCPSSSSMVMITIVPQPNAGTDGSMVICDNSATTIDLFSLITGELAGGIWTSTSGTGGTFNPIAGTYIPEVGATTHTFTYTFPGTAPCINDSSVATVFVNDCTNQAVCGGTFTDTGGANANYSNNSNFTTIICPTVPGEAVTVTFIEFNTEANFDALYVYNGPNESIQNLIPSTNAAGNVPGSIPGGYWGNTIPGPFTSSTEDGCLTFRFLSDGNNTLGGWVANVTCNPVNSVQCATPSALVSTNITSTSATLNWTQPPNSNNSVVTAWDVLVLAQGSPAPTDSSFGILVQSNSFTVNGLSPDGCYTAYVRALCNFSSEWESVNFCMVNCENNADCAESLALIAFVDTNNNGVKDSGEVNFSFGNFVYQINDSGSNLYGFSNNGPFYIFDQNPNNSYDIDFEISGNFNNYYISPVTHTNITLPQGSGSNYLYFPVTINQQYTDAQAYLYSSGGPRPGFTYTNVFSYKNNGPQAIANGTLVFTKDPALSIVSVSEPGATLTPSGFTYNFTNLGPFESRYIFINLSVPPIPTVNLGDLVTNFASIIISDADASNNSSTCSQMVVGSYDPNDKMESHGGKIVHSSFTSNDYLYYTIQFENTGTASAEFIRVNDLLNSQLDESTFEMISASHTVNTKREGNELIWHFYNVNLPTTSSNPTGSHGYINFRIKPKAGYAVGDIIPNTAYIYFDYNPAIVTNTFDTEFVLALGIPTFDANSISLSPNPASNVVTITNNNLEGISSVSIYDITGKKIYTLSDNILTNISINVASFAKGLYLIELLSDTNSKVTKKLILK
jgi:hypothetical protein